jgi:SAM-dependent methyltransferase
MTNSIDYDYRKNLHTISGPQAALPYVFAQRRPASLLDVGCGPGTWIRASIESGIADVFGVDGVRVDDGELLFPPELFRQLDLTQHWSLGRSFDAALCLEVAEHLAPGSAPALVDSLVKHSNLVVFSAGCPGQPGQHHVNCQWADYWQELFNARGYVCSDALRWSIWDIQDIEPWYRQNIFIARRDPAAAGQEPRIKRVIHPDMLNFGMLRAHIDAANAQAFLIEDGSRPMQWYMTVPVRAFAGKVRRRLARRWVQYKS